MDRKDLLDSLVLQRWMKKGPRDCVIGVMKGMALVTSARKGIFTELSVLKNWMKDKRRRLLRIKRKKY